MDQQESPIYQRSNHRIMDSSGEGAHDLTAFLSSLKDTKTELVKSSQITIKKFQREDRKFHMEFEISKLFLPLKKHLMFTCIIHGQMFKYADSFACVRDESYFKLPSPQSQSNSLYMYIIGPSILALISAIGLLERCVEEIKEEFAPTKRRNTRFDRHPKAEIRPTRKSWKNVFEGEFELKDYPYDVISNIVTKGIIEGDIFLSTEAIVCANGSPFLAMLPDDGKTRPLYLFIQAPTQQALNMAKLKIESLIHEVTGASEGCADPLAETSKHLTPPVNEIPENKLRVQLNPCDTDSMMQPSIAETLQSVPIQQHPTSLLQQHPPTLQPSMFHQSSPSLQPSFLEQPPKTLQPSMLPATHQPPHTLQPSVLPQPQPSTLPMTHQLYPTLEPPKLTTTQQPSQEHLLSDVIQQLQQYIQENGPST